MDNDYYAALLQSGSRKTENPEALWDARAKSFSDSQRSSDNTLAREAVDYLHSRGLVAGKTLLDVGGGAGRYAVLFGPGAKSVTLTDLSANMIDQAKENVSAAGLSNVEYLKLDWANCSVSGTSLEKSHDVAFAAMCPAVRGVDGLQNLMAASREHCVIHQYILARDSLQEALSARTGIRRKGDPHNDRVFVYTLFNWLWTAGYNPSIHYVSEYTRETFTPREAALRYAHRNAEACAEKGLSLEEVFTELAGGKPLESVQENRLAVMWWNVNKQ